MAGLEPTTSRLTGSRRYHWAMGPACLREPSTEHGPKILKVNRTFNFQKLAFWTRSNRTGGRTWNSIFSKASLIARDVTVFIVVHVLFISLPFVITTGLLHLLSQASRWCVRLYTGERRIPNFENSFCGLKLIFLNKLGFEILSCHKSRFLKEIKLIFTNENLPKHTRNASFVNIFSRTKRKKSSRSGYCKYDLRSLRRRAFLRYRLQ